MIDYITGVSEQVISSGLPVAFEAKAGCLYSSVPGTSVVHHLPLVRCQTREQGRAVGENLAAAVARGVK